MYFEFLHVLVGYSIIRQRGVDFHSSLSGGERKNGTSLFYTCVVFYFILLNVLFFFELVVT